MPEQCEVREYLTEDDRSPFLEWLDSLCDRRARARIEARLARVRLGNLGDYSPVGKGVQELRIFSAPGYRVYFGFESNTIVVLLCGGTKSSQRRDITAAKAYWHDYRSRDDG